MKLSRRSVSLALVVGTLSGLGVFALVAPAPAGPPAPSRVSVTSASAAPAAPTPAVPAPSAALPGAAPLTLRWSVPEPQLIAGRVERRLVHGSAELGADTVEAARNSGDLAPLRAALDAVYTQLEARTPRDIRFTRVGQRWIGEARTGWTVDRAASERQLLQAIADGRAGSPLDIRLSAPPRSVRWAKAQGLGHVGTGSSSFVGSPDFRVHNIRMGAGKLHGRWIEPGGAFDFNALIGGISAASGFQPGFVVTGNTLSLEDGGGLCQVSTTVFRAAMTAGLPILERHAHSYQVGYYGEPGLDAAVYAPSKTLRWRNDFAGPLLVQTSWDVKAGRLEVQLFARPDGRRVRIGEPLISAPVRSPDPTFIADKSMTAGAVRRVDMPAPGASVKVVREVTRPDGQVDRDVTRSTYRAWGGVFAVAPGDDRLR